MVKSFFGVVFLLCSELGLSYDPSNIVNGPDNIIQNGKYNNIDGAKNIIFDGSENNVKGDKNKILGDENDVTGNKNKISGSGNEVHGSGNVVKSLSEKDMALIFGGVRRV